MSNQRPYFAHLRSLREFNFEKLFQITSNFNLYSLKLPALDPGDMAIRSQIPLVLAYLRGFPKSFDFEILTPKRKHCSAYFSDLTVVEFCKTQRPCSWFQWWNWFLLNVRGIVWSGMRSQLVSKILVNS